MAEQQQRDSDSQESAYDDEQVTHHGYVGAHLHSLRYTLRALRAASCASLASARLWIERS